LTQALKENVLPGRPIPQEWPAGFFGTAAHEQHDRASRRNRSFFETIEFAGW